MLVCFCLVHIVFGSNSLFSAHCTYTIPCLVRICHSMSAHFSARFFESLTIKNDLTLKNLLKTFFLLILMQIKVYVKCTICKIHFLDEI